MTRPSTPMSSGASTSASQNWPVRCTTVSVMYAPSM